MVNVFGDSIATGSGNLQVAKKVVATVGLCKDYMDEIQQSFELGFTPYRLHTYVEGSFVTPIRVYSGMVFVLNDVATMEVSERHDIVGLQGDTGPSGARGLKGDSSGRGPAGSRGPTGKRSVEGSEGHPGKIGKMGPVGARGGIGARGKKGKNYRPLSLLPCISKLYERDMYNQIKYYLENHLSPCLFGFRKAHSIEQ